MGTTVSYLVVIHQLSGKSGYKVEDHEIVKAIADGIPEE